MDNRNWPISEAQVAFFSVCLQGGSIFARLGNPHNVHLPGFLFEKILFVSYPDARKFNNGSSFDV